LTPAEKYDSYNRGKRKVFRELRNEESYGIQHRHMKDSCRFVPYTENNMFYFPASALIITLCNNT